MARWKYAYRRERIKDRKLVDRLNELGDDGWALIGPPREAPGCDPILPVWDCLLRRVTSGRELAYEAFLGKHSPEELAQMDAESARQLGQPIPPAGQA